MSAEQFVEALSFPKRFGTAVRAGFKKGLGTGFMLLRIMIPVYLIVVILKYSPVMPFLEGALSSSMKIFALPGEGALPLVSGVFSDEYGVVAAMKGFSFTRAEITTMAMMTLCFHSLPLEIAVGQKIGFKQQYFFPFRLFICIATGIICGLIFGVIGDNVI